MYFLWILGYNGLFRLIANTDKILKKKLQQQKSPK